MFRRSFEFAKFEIHKIQNSKINCHCGSSKQKNIFFHQIKEKFVFRFCNFLEVANSYFRKPPQSAHPNKQYIKQSLLE